MPKFGLNRLRSIGLLSNAGLPIAVDFGAASLKVLQAHAGDPPTLVAAAELPTPEALAGDPAKRLAWQFEQLPQVMKSGGFKGKRVVCAIPASHTFCKHVQLATGDGADLADLTASAVAGQLACLPDSLLCRPVVVQGASTATASKAEVIALTAARAFVGRLMDAVRACRLEPVGMHPECVALLRAFDHITRRAEDAGLVSLYLDMGYGTTTVAVAHGTDLVFAKHISIGGRLLDQTVSKQAFCGLGEARAMRLRMTALTRASSPAAANVPAGMAALEAAIRKAQAAQGRPMQAAGAQGAAEAAEPAGGVATATEDRRATSAAPKGCSMVPAPSPADAEIDPRVDLREPLETLTDEISMCLRYYDGLFPGRRVSRAIFVGGEARHTALCQHVAKALRLPAHVADPLARLARGGGEPLLNVALNQPQPGWAVAMGLCLSPTDL
ncbi:MAG: pilus assembly protein PilM [Phycisphaeraceae bacterium]|nr:pilus assembly protein PilM [Phycisphaeraceae bacterium]